jgi:lipopolysaccharide export system protein LptA
MKRVKAGYVLGVLASLLFALPASAQLSRDGGQTQINADKLNVAERDSIAVYLGDVDVVQGDARLRSDKLTINFAGNPNAQNGGGFGEILGMLAEGNVFYITPELRARGNQGTYDASTETIILTGNVIVSRCDDVAKGERLTFNVATGQSSLDGAADDSRVVTIIGGPQTENNDGCARN